LLTPQKTFLYRFPAAEYKVIDAALYRLWLRDRPYFEYKVKT
jgi:hypothetical protein